jgi:hypothetical protein
MLPQNNGFFTADLMIRNQPIMEKSGKKIASGILNDAFTRVVREDPVGGNLPEHLKICVSFLRTKCVKSSRYAFNFVRYFIFLIILLLLSKNIIGLNLYKNLNFDDCTHKIQ